MKKIEKLALLGLLFLFTFSSCTKEVEEQCLTSSCMIVGTWNQMQSIGMMGTATYNRGDIVWTFNSNGTVAMVWNVDWNGDPLSPSTSEIENYTINGNEIEIGGVMYDLSINNRGEFRLTGNLALDGSMRDFELN